MLALNLHKVLEPYVLPNSQYALDDSGIANFELQLKTIIDDQYRRTTTLKSFTSFIDSLLKNGTDLINHAELRDTTALMRYKLLGIAVLDCVLDVSDELSSDRRTNIAGCIRKLIENEKASIESSMNVLRYASLTIGHFARIASTTEIEYLQNFYLPFTMKLISDSKTDSHRYAGIYMLHELAVNLPQLVYAKRKLLLSPVWDLVSDKIQPVREIAAKALDAILLLISQRESISDYIKSALKYIQSGFTSNSTEKILGSLLILEILCGGKTVTTQDLLDLSKLPFNDVVLKVFQRKDAREVDVRLKIIDLIPRLAVSFTTLFLQQNQISGDQPLLVFAVKHLLNSTKAITDRTNSFLALGNIFVLMLPQLRPTGMLSDLFSSIVTGMREPFCNAALTCLGTVLGTSSSSVKRFVTADLIDLMFQGGFKTELIETLKIVVKHVPSILDHVQYQLRTSIATVLLKYGVFLEDTPNKPRAGGSIVARKANNISVFGSPSKVAQSSKGLFGGSHMFNSGNGISHTIQSSNTAAQDPSTLANQNKSAEFEIILALQTLASPSFFPKQVSRDRAVPEVYSKVETRSRAPSIHNPLTLQILNSESDSVLTHVSKSANLEVYQHQTLKLMQVLRECVIKFFDDYNENIRRTSVLTTSYILEILIADLDNNFRSDIFEIIDRVLVAAISDEIPDIRAKIFNSLAPSLDFAISQSTSVNCVIEGLNDESIEVRSAAMTLFCRIAHFDTFRLMPLVRMHLKSLLSQIQNYEDESLRSESVLLLQAMVKGSDILMAPYVNQVLGPLMLLINDSSPTVVGAALTTIAELAFSSPNSVRNYLDDLVSRLILALNDTSSTIQRDIAVAAIGKLVPALTNVTDEPYKKYPGLLEGLYRAIRSSDETAMSLRTEAIRTAGLLGIVDSSVYDSHLRQLRKQEVDCYTQSDNLDEDEEEDEDADLTTEPPSLPEKDKADNSRKESIKMLYFSVIIRQIVDIVKDDRLSSHHENATKVTTKIVSVVGTGALKHLDLVVNAFLYRLYRTERGNNLVDILIDQVITLVEVVGNRMRQFLQPLIKLIHDFISTHLQRCLELLDAMYSALQSSDFAVVLNSSLSVLLSTIKKECSNISPNLDIDSSYNNYDDESKNSINITVSSKPSFHIDSLKTGTSSRLHNLLTSPQIATSKAISTFTGGSNVVNATAISKKIDTPESEKIFVFLGRISQSLGDYKQQVFPILSQVLGNNMVNIEGRKLALATLIQLSSYIHSSDYSSLVIHPLLRVLTPTTDMSIVGYVVTALSCVLCRLGTDYSPFIVAVRRKLNLLPYKDSQKLPSIEEYEVLVNRLLKLRTLPKAPSNVNDFQLFSVFRYRSHSHFTGNFNESDLGPQAIGMQALENAWAFGKSDTSDLIDWMRRLSIELIRQSPSPIIRSCLSLAKVYRPLAEGLFNIAFHCIWEELYSGESIDICEDIPLINGIEMALQSVHLPPQMMVSLLNLARFMDMQDRRLPLDLKLLATRAHDANMFAKCLRYRELEYSSKNLQPTKECIEELIVVNNELGLPDRALGVLHCLTSDYPHINIEPYWLEKLNLWEEAKESHLQLSNSFRSSHPDGNCFQFTGWTVSEIGILRCLQSLGEYEQAQSKAKDLKIQLRQFESENDFVVSSTTASTSKSSPGQPSPAVISNWMNEIQRLGAYSSWRLGQWDQIEEFVDYSTRDPFTFESTTVRLDRNLAFYHTIIAIQKKEFGRAMYIIKETRNKLSSIISALLSESYPRAYRAMVTMQILAELEEIVEYKEAVSNALGIGPPIDPNSPRAYDAYESALQRPTSKSPSPRQSLPWPSSDLTIQTSSQDATTSPSISEITSTRDILKLKKASLLKKWRGRLRVAPKEISVFRQIIAVHSLVVDFYEDLDSSIELINLCRKEGMFTLCENILRKLGAPLVLNESPDTITHSTSEPSGIASKNEPGSTAVERAIYSGGNSYGQYRILLSTVKYWWSSGSRQKALSEINGLLRTLPSIDPSAARSTLSPLASLKRSSSTEPNNNQDMREFRVKCLMKKAEWMRVAGEGELEEVMSCLLEARELSPDNYSVWHAWAVINFDQLQATDADKGEDEAPGSPQKSFPSNQIPFKSRFRAASIDGDDFFNRAGKALVARSTITNNNTRAVKHPTNYTPSSISEKQPASFRRSVTLNDALNGPANPGEPVYSTPSKTKTARRRSSIGQGTVSLANLLNLRNEDKVAVFVTEAIKGFVRSILLGQGSSSSSVLQDTLRLLTLWFSYGASKEGIAQIVDTELDKLAPEHWLSVLPQLIARIHVKTPAISNTLRKLLVKVAVNHPQALVCPIYVALNTNDEQQKKVAIEVLNEMRKRRNQLVEEATIVSRELMRVAVTPHEMWFDGIEKACTAYLEGNIQSMLSTLTALHDSMTDDGPILNDDDLSINAVGETRYRTLSASYTQSQSFSGSPDTSDKIFKRNSNTWVASNASNIGMRTPPITRSKYDSQSIIGSANIALIRSTTTALESVGTEKTATMIGRSSLRDIAFRYKYGRLLADAGEWLNSFKQSGITTELHQAWDIYYIVFKKIEAQVRTFKRLLLPHVAPDLASVRDLRLAVPGTYQPSEGVISITKFSLSVRVIQSKQRPRRITMTGSDGKVYPFLLKGNEDLRQDERVMQLFGLINVCISSDHRTRSRVPGIVRYSVLPLSNNAGLIGWVRNCDTFNQLITDYRQSRNIRPGVEMKVLATRSQNYDMGLSKNASKNSLTLMQKLEIFEYVLEETTGNDISNMLWLKSNTSDIWVERRANFTRSMAVTSIAGYILGLGDRHPSNLMLHRVSGRVVHIDFGDCFEITATRAKFPELVPFRLTRMLQNAMERSGMEGGYRGNCERLVRILRDNKDSVMAMLEAFVYDPLISWKLLTGKSAAPVAVPGSEAGTDTSNATAILTPRGTHVLRGGDMNPVDLLREQMTKPMASRNSDSNPSGDNIDVGSNSVGTEVLRTIEASGDSGTGLRPVAGALHAHPIVGSVIDGSAIMQGRLAAARGSTADGPAATDDDPLPENLNSRALEVITRIQAKLTGRDFAKSDDSEDLTVEQQVDRLILEATSNENLCQMFAGWCPMW